MNCERQLSSFASFEDIGLAEPLIRTCRELGFRRPTPVQRIIIPFLLKHKQDTHVLALAETGSGKTAAFLLPIFHHLVQDPVGIYAVILTPTRELAKQIHQQVLALGSAYAIQSALVVGGLDTVRQSCALDALPHVCVATPGRFATLLRGPRPPRLSACRYLVLDEADRLLVPASGFERDVAEVVLHCQNRKTICQTLLFSATMTQSLQSLQEIAGAGLGRLPLRKFVIREGLPASSSSGKSASSKADEEKDKGPVDGEDKVDLESSKKRKVSDEELDSIPKIPEGLKQEYIFMPSRVRDAYLLTAIRALMAYGGRSSEKVAADLASTKKAQRGRHHHKLDKKSPVPSEDEENQTGKARSAIVFVSTCERAALVSGILTHVGVDNVALHSLLSQNRRLASLAKFKSQHVRVLVATDVASRGLDIPTVDLVINSELPRSPIAYVHRVGRTARAGRRGRAISLVSESEISLVHAAERVSGRELEKCTDVTDEMAIEMLSPVAKAARFTKMKLMEIGFDELVEKFKERKIRDRKERERLEKVLKKIDS